MMIGIATAVALDGPRSRHTSAATGRAEPAVTPRRFASPRAALVRWLIWWARGQYAEGLAWIEKVLTLPAVQSGTRATVLEEAGAPAARRASMRGHAIFSRPVWNWRRSGGSTRNPALTLNLLAAAVCWGFTHPRPSGPIPA